MSVEKRTGNEILESAIRRLAMSEQHDEREPGVPTSCPICQSINLIIECQKKAGIDGE